MGVEKEIPPIELLTPLTGEFFPDDSGYDYEDEIDSEYGEEMTGRDLVDYTDSIIEAVEKENSYGKDGRTCDLMDYFWGNESIKEKVKSAVVSVKNIEGELFGCTTLKLREFLDAPELEELCEYITGQYSDGWGEGFEQREIEVDGGTLYVHFWQSKNYEMKQSRQAQTEETSAEMPKKRPKLKLLGHDGNIFSILGDARRLLRQNGQNQEADEMLKRVEKSEEYHQALHIISEYVETELSKPQIKGEKKKKPEKGGECR